jgi:hypothetical protein
MIFILQHLAPGPATCCVHMGAIVIVGFLLFFWHAFVMPPITALPSDVKEESS